METQPIVILGAGGFGREVLDVVEAVNEASRTPIFEVVGFLDDGRPDLDLLRARGMDHLGRIEALSDMPSDVGYVIGIGSGAVRRELDAFGRREDRHSPTVVHPSVTRGFDVDLGPGTIVCSHVSLTTNISIGRHVHLNLNTTVGHDVRIHDYVTVSPLVAISGEVTIESEVLIGTGACVNQSLTIGRGSVLGSGAAAVKDIPGGAVAVGVPAKPR